MRSGAGALTGMMMTLKGLPLAYNKDMQEDKEGLFDALDTRLDCLHMAALVLDGIQVKRPRCREAAQQVTPTLLNWRIIWWRKAYRSARRTILWVKLWWKPFVRAKRWKICRSVSCRNSAGDWRRCLSDSVAAIVPRQACSKGGVSPQQVAQAIALRRRGWGNLFILLP